MNTSEQLYHMNDTLEYLSNKVDKELRYMKELLRKVLDEIREMKKDPLRDGFTMSI